MSDPRSSSDLIWAAAGYSTLAMAAQRGASSLVRTLNADLASYEGAMTVIAIVVLYGVSVVALWRSGKRALASYRAWRAVPH